jgi:hypothetical protein
VKLSIFLGDPVYGVAVDRIKVQRINAFGIDVAELSLQHELAHGLAMRSRGPGWTRQLGDIAAAGSVNTERRAPPESEKRVSAPSTDMCASGKLFL